MIAKRKSIKKVNISHNAKIEPKSESNQGTKELMLNHVSNNGKIPNLLILEKIFLETPSWGKEMVGKRNERESGSLLVAPI